VISIILQVRIASTRLPGKLLLPLCGKSIFEHILMRLQAALIPSSIIVATTRDTACRIDSIVEQFGVPLYVGSEEDVLLRFVEAARENEVDTVIRATGDNPLVSIPYIDRAVELHSEKSADLTLYPRLPYGTGVEVIRGAVLEEISGKTDDPFEREHITQYLYRHESDYRIIRGVPEEALRRPDIRLTVDTEEDYRNMGEIYENLYRGRPIPLHEVISYLNNR
jgi:spore coat polysaccharide biosynthesis protein SpsF